MEYPNLHGLDVGAAVLSTEWLVTVDTPVDGIPPLLDGLEDNIPMLQGPYDCCSFVLHSGYQRFRALEGSHAGAESTIQQTAAAKVIFSIPADEDLLKRVFETLFRYHVNEEPTIRVQPVWGSRSKLLDDKDNPYRYWNRPDSERIHGEPAGEKK